MRCKAHRRNGEQCRSHPIRGAVVCRMHGGSAPQVRAKAQERLELLAIKALGVMDELMEDRKFPTTRFAAGRFCYEQQHGRAVERVDMQVSGEVTLASKVAAARKRLNSGESP